MHRVNSTIQRIVRLMASLHSSFCLLSALILAASAVGCGPSGFRITPVPADQTIQEQIVERGPFLTSDRIAIIDISGVLMDAHAPGLLSEGENPVSFTIEKLTAATNDDRVKAVVLRVNSPGGGVTASDIIYQEILRFKKSTGKPVIAYFLDVAASGAYYVSCAADEIIAQRTGITGSIGVIMQMIDLTGTLNKLGVETDAIKSGPHKDTGSPFRRMRPEERELFQTLVNGMYSQFVSIVEAGRPGLTHDQVLTLADGRVYSADQALENGLIDSIGTMHDAIDAAKRRAHIQAAQVVLYHRPLAWTPNMYATAQAPSGNSSSAQTINLLNINIPPSFTSAPRFMYIWESSQWPSP